MIDDDKVPEPPAWFVWIPVAALTLSITILLFQVFVLHGWHMRISHSLARKLS